MNQALGQLEVVSKRTQAQAICQFIGFEATLAQTESTETKGCVSIADWYKHGLACDGLAQEQAVHMGWTDGSVGQNGWWSLSAQFKPRMIERRNCYLDLEDVSILTKLCGLLCGTPLYSHKIWALLMGLTQGPYNFVSKEDIQRHSPCVDNNFSIE